MKQTRLLEIIREEISSALREGEMEEKAAKMAQIKAIDAKQKALDAEKRDTMKSGALEEDTLNEVPDFGGRYDKQVSDKYGEDQTLEDATKDITDEILKDMGVSRDDLKKDADKAKDVLKAIRSKVVGKARDPRVAKALKKQEEFDDSGNALQANQTNNAILKALGLKEPGQRGRKASEKSEPKEKSPKSKTEPKSKSEPKSKESKTDAGTDDEGNKVEIDTTIKTLTGDKEIETKLKDVISKKKDKLKAALKSKDQETYNKEKAALKQFLEKPEIAKYIKKKTVDKVNPYTISSIEDEIK
jgi:uncharacterized phage infection (PIP) family protein YhgE